MAKFGRIVVVLFKVVKACSPCVLFVQLLIISCRLLCLIMLCLVLSYAPVHTMIVHSFKLRLQSSIYIVHFRISYRVCIATSDISIYIHKSRPKLLTNHCLEYCAFQDEECIFDRELCLEIWKNVQNWPIFVQILCLLNKKGNVYLRF